MDINSRSMGCLYNFCGDIYDRLDYETHATDFFKRTIKDLPVCIRKLL